MTGKASGGLPRWYPLPTEVYAQVERTPATVLLESAKSGEPESGGSGLNGQESGAERWSRLFTAPLRVVTANQPADLPKLFAEIEVAVAAGQQAAGFFSYECGNCFEPKAGQRPGPPGQPLAWFGIYDHCYRFDHWAGVFPDGNPPGLSRFLDGGSEDQLGELPIETSLDLTEAQYSERIAAVHDWICAGDVYQLNYTVPLRVKAWGSLAALYARLRRRQPVEYGAFLHWQPGRRIFSFSPELFFRLESDSTQLKNGDLGRRIITQPMKGTVARGRTTREDQAMAEWLRNDPKNRSENVMIVDLLRNDLGRLCEFGSVRVKNLFAVERHPTLWQMTSTITGALRPEVDYQQIFRALFPCGSVTGAPKVRAMQLLAQIEEEPRGIYTGSIGFFSRQQTVFNVAIRTLELNAERSQMGIGGGIVADSSASGEFRECQLKAEFLTRSADSFPECFSLVETLLWRQGFPLIELHLDRLEDSADYFDFACDRAEAKSALLTHAATFADSSPRKVRLLLNRDGGLLLSNEILAGSSAATGDVDAGQASPTRVRIAAQRTDPHDRMLFHKTTHRPLYTKALQAAKQADFGDVLFLNQNGEVTESAIANIFVEVDGQWFTPPVECGLLSGIYRRCLLEARPEIEAPGPLGRAIIREVKERVLYPQDLRQASAIYLANAVRGLRRIVIDWEA